MGSQLRTAFTKAARELDARRKIIVGGTVMAAMNDDPELRARVRALSKRQHRRDPSASGGRVNH